MSKVILDNWSLASAFLQILNTEENFQLSTSKLCLSNLLTALILWDEIDFIEVQSIKDFLKRLQQDHKNVPLGNLFSPIVIPGFKETEGFPTQNYADENSLIEFNSMHTEESKKRLNIYLNLRDDLQLNYYPHPIRADLIYNESQKNNQYDRYQLIDSLDKALLDYYEELNKKYKGGLINFSYPVLYDYIRKEANTPLDEMLIALEIRKMKNVVELRQGLDRLDEALNKGNRPIVISAQKQINELSKTISSDLANNKEATLGEIEAKITFPDIQRSSLEYSKKFKLHGLSGKKGKILNLTFLERLKNFGIGKQVK